MVILCLAEGFEEMEALTPVDILRRGGVDVKTVGIGGKNIRSVHDITVEADLDESEIPDTSEIEMIILPGGIPGASNLDKSATVDRLLKELSAEGKYMAAICAAPMVLGQRDYLQGKNVCCYPGFEDKLLGANILNEDVVVDGKIITSKGPVTALAFSLELLSILKGEEAVEAVKSKIYV